MKRVLGWAALSLLAIAVVGASQRGKESTDPDPFQGTWKINIEKSQELSAGRSRTPVYEVISFDVTDGVQHYRVEVQSRDDTPRRRMGYDSKYNDGKFVPYTNYGTGEVNGYVTTVKVDDRTHYRIARTVDGEAQYVLMRQVTENGKAYIAASLSVSGEPGAYRWMDKVE